jgi:hypothetical protein
VGPRVPSIFSRAATLRPYPPEPPEGTTIHNVLSAKRE